MRPTRQLRQTRRRQRLLLLLLLLRLLRLLLLLLLLRPRRLLQDLRGLTLHGPVHVEGGEHTALDHLKEGKRAFPAPKAGSAFAQTVLSLSAVA